MYTIKEIAAAACVGKQQVYRYIKKNHINEAHREAGVLIYDEAVKEQVISHFSTGSASREAHHSMSYDVVLKQLETLRNEIEFKNEQIRELNSRLGEVTSALMNAQSLHAGEIRKEIAAKPPGLLSRLFKRK